jgi:hypothetical protein
MTVHEKPVGATVEWYTPPELFAKLDLEFDLDPASPNPPVPWVPAARFMWQDGHTLPWTGRVWLNPPYGPKAVPFVERMIAHGDGMLLLPARTETRAFQRAATEAKAVCFLRERLWFKRADGFQARSSFGSVLFAFGWDCWYALQTADLGFTVSND